HYLLIVVRVAVAWAFPFKLKTGGAHRRSGLVDLKIAPAWMQHFDNRVKGAFPRDRAASVAKKEIPQPVLVSAKMNLTLANGAKALCLEVRASGQSVVSIARFADATHRSFAPAAFAPGPATCIAGHSASTAEATASSQPQPKSRSGSR